ncbi:MAG TPA: zf-HC2 domain-containing protein [Pyrinomonadaceae bacterium]|nr:zf-HC2 domain-containing protein [Pyrinomonadaceae bacterium]
MMSCEETSQALSSYLDDCVSLPVRVAIDEHLDRCPVCRAEVAELRSLTRSLNLMTRPKPPAGLADTISDLLTIEAAARVQAPSPSFGRRVACFLEPWLMPYSVGSFASVILFTLMLAGLRPHVMALHEAALATKEINIYEPVTPEVFAASRAPFAEQSPSLDPDGALAALTRAYLHPNDSNGDADDMIVVADVFSNGSASLADVVKAPKDKRMLDEFESALRQDPAFVKAALDRRPDTMRVVFAVQKVDVNDRNF